MMAYKALTDLDHANEKLAHVSDANVRARSQLYEADKRIKKLDAALAEAVAVAGKWRAHHAEKGSTERATYWNDLAVRWQDARAEANQKGTGE